MDKRSFLESPLGKDCEIAVSNGAHMTYRFRPESGVGALVSFFGDTLTTLTWGFELPGENPNEWSEDLELRRKRVHDEWLSRELGAPPYVYVWGQISSGFDSKGCVSDIILTYAE
jgi:hypothetical protein